jgi:hypothetical protein
VVNIRRARLRTIPRATQIAAALPAWAVHEESNQVLSALTFRKSERDSPQYSVKAIEDLLRMEVSKARTR